MAEDIKTAIKKYQDLLKSSKTAYTPNTAPTESDVYNQGQLMLAKNALASQQSEEAKQQWYGDQGEDENAKAPIGQTSKIHSILKTLGTPLYGIVGALETGLGKGTKSGLLANIQANVQEEGTMGDLLRSYKIPNMISAPLGFLLDVGLDPVNWMGVGIGATIPRIAKGLVKAGPRGVALGAKSAALQKLEMAGRLVPGLTSRAFPATGEAASGAMAGAYRGISAASQKASKEYAEAIGESQYDRLIRMASGDTKMGRLEKKVGEVIKEKAPALDRGFGYHPGNLPVEELSMPEPGNYWDDIFPSKYTPQKAKDFVEESADAAMNPPKYYGNNGKDTYDKLKQEAILEKRSRRTFDEQRNRLMSILQKSTKPGDKRALEHLLGLEEGSKEWKEFHSGFNYYKSLNDTYDKYVAKALLSDTGRKFLNNYAKYIGLFKTAKIGGNLATALTNATVGNLAMTAMYGINLGNTGLMSSLAQSAKLFILKRNKEIAKFFNDPEMLRLMNENPREFYMILGMHPEMITNQVEYLNRVASMVASDLKSMGKSEEGMGELMNLINSVRPDPTQKLSKTISNALAKAPGKVRKEAFSTLGNEPNVTLTQEVLSGPFGEFVKKIKELGETGRQSTAMKLAHLYLTAPMDWYSKSDQIYRLGLMNHLWKNGVTETELASMLKRGAPIAKEDIVSTAGRNIFKIKPRSGLKVAQEVYMNYLAMPAFVKAMRTLPIVGSPFFSFVYGMSAITGKTAMYNPGLFNKVQFGMKEISGDKSPLEKQALMSKYYQWLNKDGMVKLPLFQDNPIYLNTENWIPYYTMNIFQPMERTYEERFGSAAAALLDRLPFLKDPAGQVIYDYIIQPQILQEAQPKGVFNQPLWPADAGLLKKAGYTVRGMAETITPPMLGYLGLITPQNQTLIESLPSFRWRQMARSVGGPTGKSLTSIGAISNEPKTSRGLRTAAAISGWPVYSMKLQYNKK